MIKSPRSATATGGMTSRRSGLRNTSRRKSTSKIGDETVLSQNLRAALAGQNKQVAFPSCFELLQSEASCIVFIMKINFQSCANKLNFHIKNFALILPFIMRLKATQEFYFMLHLSVYLHCPRKRLPQYLHRNNTCQNGNNSEFSGIYFGSQGIMPKQHR